jgi:UDP-N-acetylglucosamine/UDP-N-acetylgalactosamine diphosphorylase
VLDLLERGVEIHSPASVFVDGSVQPERISPGVVIHAGCRLSGQKTSIGPGCELGREAPATVEDCRLGHGVKLKGGYFSGAVFLDGAEMGAAAHVRPGTLLEEEANGAHAVGFKHTIFLPFVTAGSLINFCDCLMAGGTSRKNHSEIGSSYIHFNYTPHQDKATASLIGDVPRGVMLDQSPIFLGGQGGLVGPARIEFGTVIPAGAVFRGDVLEPGTLARPLDETARVAARGGKPFDPAVYRRVDRIVCNNLLYIGNLWALAAWYEHVRQPVMTTRDEYTNACYEGALEVLQVALKERISRLGAVAAKMPPSIEKARGEGLLPAEELEAQVHLAREWHNMKEALEAGPPPHEGGVFRDRLLAEWADGAGESSYLEAVAALGPDARKAGTQWLSAIVTWVAGTWTRKRRA